MPFRIGLCTNCVAMVKGGNGLAMLEVEARCGGGAYDKQTVGHSILPKSSLMYRIRCRDGGGCLYTVIQYI